jgi:hypothetical protein
MKPAISLQSRMMAANMSIPPRRCAYRAGFSEKHEP